MPNKSGQAYGLTVLSPIIDSRDGKPTHADQLRQYLDAMPLGADSPLARVSTTHVARWVIIEDVFYEGHPAHQDHLQSKYLLFTSNFDGELDDYLKLLAGSIPDVVNAIWKHCVGFRKIGVGDLTAFVSYIKRCQVETGLFFADYNDASVSQVLRALQTQKMFVDFVQEAQDMPAPELRDAFMNFMEEVRAAPTPKPGTM